MDAGQKVTRKVHSGELKGDTQLYKRSAEYYAKQYVNRVLKNDSARVINL